MGKKFQFFSLQHECPQQISAQSVKPFGRLFATYACLVLSILHIFRQMSKSLVGVDGQQLSNELSAPYEVPQFPIEQIESKLLRLVGTSKHMEQRISLLGKIQWRPIILWKLETIFQ